MTIKRYLPSGLKIGGSNLTDKDGCSDVLNLYKTRGGEWRKKPGALLLDSNEGGKGLFETYGDINVNSYFFSSNSGSYKISLLEAFSTTKYGKILGFDSALKEISGGIWSPITATTGFSNSNQKIMSIIPLPNKTFLIPTLDGLWKYDGVSFRKAMTPFGDFEINNNAYDEIQIALASRNAVSPKYGGLTNSGTYYYKFRFRCVDAQGNIFFSPLIRNLSTDEDFHKIILGAADDQVMIQPIFGSNFDTVFNKYARKAKISGDQTTSGQTFALNVDSGHTLVIGDLIPLTSTVSLGRIDCLARVTATTATAITVKLPEVEQLSPSQAIFSFYDDQEISSGVSLEVSRTPNGGGVYTIWGCVPLKNISNKGYESLSYHQVNDVGYLTGPMLYDGFSDSNMAYQGHLDLDSIQDVNMAWFNPKCKFGCLHQDAVIVGGDPENPNTLYYSNAGSYESFQDNDGTNPTSINAFDVGDSFVGDITGVGSSDGLLYVFCERATFAVNGIINTLNFSVTRIDTNDVGCISHATIKQIGRHIFWLSGDGVHTCIGGGEPIEISANIRPLFKNPINSLDLEWASATVHEHNNNYVLSIPALNGSDESTDSYTLVYNYHSNEWFIWDNDSSGGLAVLNDELYVQSREATEKTYKLIDGQFQDNGVNINAYAVTNWEDLDSPMLRKQFNRLRIYSIPRSAPELDYAPNFGVRVRHEENWLDELETDVTENFTSTKRFVDVGLNSNMVESARFTFQNNANEDMLISGFDLEYVDKTRKAEE